jgi:glycolate oxidase
MSAISESFITGLGEALGNANLISDPERLTGYANDETPGGKPCLPGLVVTPESTAQVSAALRLAHEYGLPVTPRGAGTGLSQGCVPAPGGLVLSLEKMNRVLDIDDAGFTASVEPGVTLATLAEALAKTGLSYPVYPGEMTASIGGTVATNAGGMNAVKHGVTRHQVLGLEAVLASGEVINSGGAFVKCASGYDLAQLITGSEGTLAVITRITLKLTRLAACREVLFVPFDRLEDAIEAVPDILRLPETPYGIEFFERSILDIVADYLETELPYRDHAAFLMVLMEGDAADAVHDYFAAVDAVCQHHGAVPSMVPGSERARRKLLDAREKFLPALRRHTATEILDIVVPRPQIARFVEQAREIGERYGIQVIAYGHAGDGNVHLHPVGIGLSQTAWRERLPGLMRELYHAGTELGGAVSGEHGIGQAKKAYLPIGCGPETLNLMRAVKQAFDPTGIMNPGKIFD